MMMVTVVQRLSSKEKGYADTSSNLDKIDGISQESNYSPSIYE